MNICRSQFGEFYTSYIGEFYTNTQVISFRGLGLRAMRLGIRPSGLDPTSRPHMQGTRIQGVKDSRIIKR